MDIKGFLTKQTAGLPNWAWLLVVVAGAGVGYYFVRKQSSSTPGASKTPAVDSVLSQPSNGAGDLTNTVPDTSSSPVYVVGSPTPPAAPGTGTDTGTGTGGNTGTGTETGTGGNTGTGTGTGTGGNTGTGTHAPGTTFLGPTGVKHYVVAQGETLSTIAAKFGLKSWNSIYAIPDNQKIFGKLDSDHARVYAPKAGTVITLPSSAPVGAGPDMQRRETRFVGFA